MKKIFLLVILCAFVDSKLLSQTLSDEIIISSTKLPQEKIVGSSTYIISREDIENYPGETQHELLLRYQGAQLKDV